MAKLVTFFAFLFVVASILTGIMEGGGGIAATELSADVDDTETTIPVVSTTNFLATDFVIIGDERILYTSDNATAFIGCTRGYDGTDAVAHSSGDNVYTADASVINNGLGFNIGATQASVGTLAVIMIPWNFFTITLPRLIMWNWAFLQGELAILAYFFFAVSIGFVGSLALVMLQVARGILGR